MKQFEFKPIIQLIYRDIPYQLGLSEEQYCVLSTDTPYFCMCSYDREEAEQLALDAIDSYYELTNK